MSLRFPTYAKIDVKEGIISLADGDVDGFSDGSAMVRFNSAGTFDAYNDTAYDCDTCNIPWVAGDWYFIEMDVNVQTQLYSVDITPCGDSPQTLITDAVFRKKGGDLTHRAIWGGTGTTIDQSTTTWTPGACVPVTCDDLGYVCGTGYSDTCGDTIDCNVPSGTCTGGCGDCGGSDVCLSGGTCCTPNADCNGGASECGAAAPAGCEGETQDCDTPGCTGDDVCLTDFTCGPAPSHPTVATVGITDYWCPRWASLKTDTSSDLTIGTNGVGEYYDVSNATVRLDGNNAVARCVRSRSKNDTRYRSTGGTYGHVWENVEVGSVEPTCTGKMNDFSSADAQTMRRFYVESTCVDTYYGPSGVLLVDSYIDNGTNHQYPSDSHSDGFQSTGGCGPAWFVNNTMLGADGCDYGDCDSCSSHPSGLCTNAMIFYQGRHSPTNISCYRKVQSLVMSGNYFKGGMYALRWSNNNGHIRNTGFWNNVFADGQFRYNYTRVEYLSGANLTTTPVAETGDYCFETFNNTLDPGGANLTTQQPNEFEDTYEEVTPYSQCGQLEPIPVTIISGESLSDTSCTEGQAACDNIDIVVTSVTTNEPARADDVRSGGCVECLLNGASPGGSFRWRYSCGGSAANADAAPCTTQAGRCNGYQVGDEGADLWYAYPDCDGNSSCTMTDVCDFQSEADGAYTVKVYAEAGPGAAYRPSDHKELTFTVDP